MQRRDELGVTQHGFIVWRQWIEQHDRAFGFEIIEQMGEPANRQPEHDGTCSCWQHQGDDQQCDWDPYGMKDAMMWAFPIEIPTKRGFRIVDIGDQRTKQQCQYAGDHHGYWQQDRAFGYWLG